MGTAETDAGATQLMDEGNEEQSGSIDVEIREEGTDAFQSTSTLDVASGVGPVRREQDRIVYPGEGTHESPFLVDWEPGDPENPYNWSKAKKWPLTFVLAAGTLCVSFASSSYSGGISFVMEDLHMSREVAVLGISLYVLGFGLGPLLFAPLSEMYGRKLIFVFTYTPYTLLHMGGALAKNKETLLICRLLAGIMGSSPLTNAGGTISDMWIPRERGVAVALYSTAPFLGPVIGPIVGGFTSEDQKLGWRFNFWIMMILSGVVLAIHSLFMPETYGPVLLRRRARRLRREAEGKTVYVSKFDLTRKRSLLHSLSINLRRPFAVIYEPIVLLLALYISVAYAILYALFAAFPIVFEEHRHFSPGESGLAFLGIGLGMCCGAALSPIQNRLYWRVMDRSPTGRAPPEARLYTAIIGGVLLPVGLFWFAWTSFPSISYFVPIFAGVPFGTAISTILQSLTAYLMDSYTVYSASAIAATVVLRSAFACAFPLFSPYMFAALGDQWAMSVFAFLSLLCMPIPFLFFKYGKLIRRKSHFAIKDEPTPDEWVLKSRNISPLDPKSSEDDKIKEKDVTRVV
ncbi:hypothetical protein ACEPAG_3958 [Sanghuangporus baumii]